MTLKPVDHLTPKDISEMRQRQLEEAEQAARWMPWLSGRVPVRVGKVLRRAYRSGQLTKPIKEHTDAELLRVRGLGLMSLAQIRDAISLKEANSGIHNQTDRHER